MIKRKTSGLRDTFTSKTTCLLVLTEGTQRFTESAEELFVLRKEVLVTWQKNWPV